MQGEMRSNGAVVQTVLARLRRGPATRQELRDEVAQQGFALRWRTSTVDRRVREALAAITVRLRVPIASTGRRYKQIERPEERDAAVRAMTRAAIAMLTRASRLNRAVMEGELRQLTLPWENNDRRDER